MKAIKDSVIYLFGEIFSKSVPFLLLPYFSRKLGADGYGVLSYYQTLLGLFLIAISLSQEGAVARYFYFYGKRSLDLIVQVGYIYAIVSSSVILVICYLVRSEILAYITIAAMFQVFLSVQLSIRQCQKKAIEYAIVQFLSGSIVALLTIFLLELSTTDLVEKRFIAVLLSNLLVFLGTYFCYIKNIRKKFHSYSFKQYKSGGKYLIGFGLPLLLHHLSLYIKGQLDRIFIYHQFTESELGVYAMGAQIASILFVLIQAVNKALIPYLFEGIKRKKIILKMIHRWALLSFLLVPIPSIIFGVVPDSVITFILGTDFLDSKYFVVLFLLSTALTIPYLFLANYLFYFGKNKWIAFCSFFSSFIYLVSLYILLNLGLEYLPIASCIANFVIVVILYFITVKIKLI